MRIAFDVDRTLIPERGEFDAAPSVPPFLRPFFPEPLRHKAAPLLRDLQGQGHEIWIYTTSGRSPAHFFVWFLFLGVRLGGVVNCWRHEKEMRHPHRSYPNCSKYPPAWNIDLLIDDSDGVAEEGKQHGFSVLLVDPADADWAEKVREAAGMR